jgi:AraC-like DNA-binding protein
MKKERQFDDYDHELLTNSDKWNVVCTGLPTEVEEINDHDHLKWMKTNTDSHAQREILLVLKGETNCSLNGKCYATIPGTMLLFNNFEKHDNSYPPETNNLEHLWLSLIGRKIILRTLKINDHKQKNYGHEYIIEKEHLFLTIEDSWNKVTNPKLTDQFKRKSLISALSLIFLEIAEQDILEYILASTKNYQATIITTIEEHIKETAGKGLTINRLARIAGYSKFHFLRIFKQNTGLRVHAYINKVRIKKVNEMLEQGYMKKEISDKLGFSCSAAFANWYRKNMPLH